MMNIDRKLINTIIIFVVAMVVGCASGLSSSNANDPESDDLLLHLNGYIIIDRPGDISSIELPSNKQLIVREPCGVDKSSAYALSGPDRKGRIAFIATYATDIYSLKIIDMATKNEKEIFTRPGSYWLHIKENYGKSFSYSGNGKFAAFVRNYDSVPALIPDDYVNIGNLEIVDTEKINTVKTDIKVLDKGLNWFPEGKKLAYVALIPKDKINKDLATNFEDGFGSDMMTWHSTPVVVLLNLKDMSTKQLHIGWNPIVSRDGSSIVIQDYQGRIRLYNIASGASILISVPIGEECHVFSFIGKDFLLYKTIPVVGRKYRFTSTGGRTPFWTLRVAQMNTSKFKTIVEQLDIHRRVSYGEGRKVK
jgi:hypothetical protein